MSLENRLRYSLFGLRFGVFIVMFMWTIDKLINPDHAARIFEKFYLISGLSAPMSYAIGGVQAVIVLAFVAGIQKRCTYGLVFLMHLVSTVSSYERYLDPWTAPNLLFFAAFPMLAAIAALYLLRNEDTFLTWGGKRAAAAA